MIPVMRPSETIIRGSRFLENFRKDRALYASLLLSAVAPCVKNPVCSDKL